MDIEKIRIVYEAAKYGSVKKAAEEMNYTQSGLMYTINAVEEELGFKLLNRTYRGVTLTEYGKQMEPLFEKLSNDLKQLEEKRDELRTEKQTVLRIGCCPMIASHWLPEVVIYMQQKYGVQFKIYAGRSEVVDWLEEGRIDFGILEQGIVGENDWEYLGDEEIYVAVPEEGVFEPGAAISLDDLKEYHVIMADHNPKSGGMKDLKKWAESLGEDHLTIYDTASAIERLKLVEKGMGITFLSSVYTDECPQGVSMHPLKPSVVRKIGMIYKQGMELNDTVKSFIKVLKSYLQEDETE